MEGRARDVKDMTKAASNANSQSKPKGKKFQMQEYMEKAQKMIDNYDFDLAKKFVDRALEIEPDSIHALEILAFINIELDDLESAFENLRRSIEIEPGTGYSKYMTLGELASGMDSRACYENGIEILKEDKDTIASGLLEGDLKMINKQIASAYCAIAELYMTDLCMEDEAESTCLEMLKKGLEEDETHTECLQLFASFSISTHNIEQANEYITRSLKTWLPNDGSDFELNETVPSFETRCSTAKLLLELERFEEAQRILDLLLKEDDEVVEVWYLYGWMSDLCEEFEMASQTLNRAAQLLASVGCENPDIELHVNELLEKYGQLGIEPDPINFEK